MTTRFDSARCGGGPRKLRLGRLKRAGGRAPGARASGPLTSDDITGYPSVETAVSAVQLAVVAYLIKPVPPEELLKVVRQTFDQRRACRSVEAIVHRVEQWHHDLQAVSASMRPKSPEAFNQTVGTFITAAQFQDTPNHHLH